MKKVFIVVTVLLLLGGGILLFRPRQAADKVGLPLEPTKTQQLTPIGDEVLVEFEPNAARTKALLRISKLKEAGVKSLEYEVLYETEGLIKGVNSGSTPIEVDESGVVEREIDFGTCSSGVCRYDKNVGKITLVVRFNTSAGPKIFKQEYL